MAGGERGEEREAMGHGIKSICELVGSVVLHSWSATARLVLVLVAVAALAVVAAVLAPGLVRW